MLEFAKTLWQVEAGAGPSASHGMQRPEVPCASAFRLASWDLGEAGCVIPTHPVLGLLRACASGSGAFPAQRPGPAPFPCARDARAAEGG